MDKVEQLYRLIWMSRPLMQAAEASVVRGLEGTGLTVRMRAVLEVLLMHGAATVPEIALRLEIKRQYVQVMVNETLAAGLTVSLANPRHKTSTMIALTDIGRSLIEAVVQRERDLVAAFGADIAAAEAATALDVVLRLVGKLKDQSGGAAS